MLNRLYLNMHIAGIEEVESEVSTLKNERNNKDCRIN